MQYTPNYNLNVPEGTDIVNPLVQDNPNWTAIDAAMYANKLRVIGTATEVTTGTVHALTRADNDIPVFRFVATSDYNTGDTFTVDGVSVTARVSDGTSPKNGAFKINTTVLCILDGTLLNLIGIYGEIGTIPATDVILSNGNDVDSEILRGYVQVTADGIKQYNEILNDLNSLIDRSKVSIYATLMVGSDFFRMDRSSTALAMTKIALSASALVITQHHIRNTSFSLESTNGNISDISTSVPPVGTNFRFYY